MGNQLFLDDASLTAYLEAHKRLGLQADYLAKIVEEKKLERDFIISRYCLLYTSGICGSQSVVIRYTSGQLSIMLRALSAN